MRIPVIVPLGKDLRAGEQGHAKRRWIVLLIVLGLEGAAALAGGCLLVASPDGRFLKMPVEIMHGTFRDFLVPGLVLAGLGFLCAAAFVAILRNSRFKGVMAALALGGLATWFWVEIAILQEFNLLHAIWGIPVMAGGLVGLPLLNPTPAMRKWLLFCGILSSLFFVGMNILVPLYYPGYSSFSQTVSELSAIGAPTKLVWNLLSIVFVLLLLAFGFGIERSAGSSCSMRASGWLLIAYALVCSNWPPMHQREVLAAGGKSLTDTMHIVFTGVTGLLMMLAMAFAATASGKQFRYYTIATILILLGFGALTGLDAPQLEANLPTPWMGVWERVNIYSTMLWLVVFAMMLLRREEKASSHIV